MKEKLIRIAEIEKRNNERIKAYNEYARQLRHLIDEDEPIRREK